MDQPAITQIERRAFRAAPAVETFGVESWTANLGRGSVSRTNSVTTFGTTALDMFEAVALVERRYRARRRPVKFRLTALDAELDDLLFARGYDKSDDVLVMRKEGVVAAPPNGSVHTPGVTSDWQKQYIHFRPADEARAAERAESLAALSLRHATFHLEGRAVGVAVLDAAWVGLFDMAVDPQCRRQSLGRRLGLDMLSWAALYGAQSSYLQVEAANFAARQLYVDLGFEDSYRYWYRSRD